MKKKFFLGLSIALFGVIAFAAIGHLKSEPTVYFSQDYENGAALDWSNTVANRFTAEIGEAADGNHYLRTMGDRAANGSGVYSNAISVPSGTPFTMTADIRLRSANGQNTAEFVVGAAGASYNFSKWTMTGKMNLSIKQVAAGGTNQWVLNGDVDNPITLPGTETLAGTDASAVYDAAPWYTFQLTWKEGKSYFSIKDKATGTYIVKKKVLNVEGDFASEGGVGQLWFQTSRYNAAFALDNVVVREVADDDVPPYYGETTEIATQNTIIHAQGSTGPADAQTTVFYDPAATEWMAGYATISGGKFVDKISNYAGATVVLSKLDLSEYLLPEGKVVDKVTLSCDAYCTTSGKSTNLLLATVENTDIDLTQATWNNTNDATILGAITQIGTSAWPQTTETVTQDITEVFEADADKVFLFAWYTSTGRDEILSNIKVTVTLKDEIVETDLAYFIKQAIEGKTAGEDAVLDLDPAIAYTFDTPADAGLVNLTINGGGKTIALADSVQIATQASLTINDLNFDCAANTKLAPIAMSANPDSSLVGSKYPVTEGEVNNLRANGFYDTGAITLNNCNFSGVKTSLVSANKREWYLKGLTIKNCIVQFDVASGIDSYINWYGNSNNEGAIKDIVIQNSTLYNIVENNDNRFLRYQNNSNSQPQKAWAEPQFDGKASWTMKNNTFVNLPSNKEFANNYPNKNNVTLDFKGNIFYNTWRLQKIASSAVRNFTAADNAICGITNPVDGTDATSYATEDTLLCKGDAPFVVPTTALDLTNLDLKENFTPCNGSYSADNEFGDPRWAGTPSGVFFANNYEKDQTVDWKTSVGGRYDPIVTVEDGNHFLCANPSSVNNNGAVMSTINTAILAAGTDFTASVDVRLGSSSDQTATEFAIYDATNSVKLLSVLETGKNVTTWFVNGGKDTLNLPGTENGAYVAGRPWYNFTLTFACGTAFLTIKDVATGAIVGGYEKTVVPCQSANGGIGKMEFTSSRYNASFAIDNVKVRELKDSDLPEGLVRTQYTVNYLFTDKTPLKEPRVANAFVGQKVAALESDIAPIYVRDSVETILGKYLIQTGANDTIELVQDPGVNNIYLVFREANKYNLGLKGNYGDNLDKQVDLGEVRGVWEGEKATLWYPQFILDGDSLWFKDFGATTANQFTYDVVMTSSLRATIDYGKKYSMFNTTDAMIKNVVFYQEAEDIPGFTLSEQPNQGVRCSMGKCAYNLEDVVLCTLEPGTYLVGNQFWGGTSSATWEIGKIAIGKDTLSTSCTGSRGQTYKMVTVTEPTDVVAKAIPQGENYTMAGYDWILVQKFVDASILTQNAKLAAGDSVDVTEFVSSTSSAAITYTSSDENVAKVEDGKLIAVGKGVATITVNQATGNGFNAATATFDVSVTALAVLPALAANAYYSWQSPAGVVEEVGGKAVASEADPTRVNYSQAPAYTQYYTICLNGKNNLSDDKYTTVTLDQALAEGDTIYVYAFKNKGEEKKSGVKFFWGAEGQDKTMACGDDFPDLYFGGEPVLAKYVVPANAAGEKVFRMSRSETGTNLFIAQLHIVPGVATGISSINENSLFNNGSVYNLRGMKVNNMKKGEIYIVNGKKYIAK